MVIVTQCPYKFVHLFGAIKKFEFNFLAYSQTYQYQKFTSGLRC